jgi:beta-lactamase regulating signal transducer with metallopeptidase domain
MNPLVQRVGWMLVHSVWEDVLIWCVFQVAVLLLARKSPQARYLAACTALVAMAGLPWLTFDAADLMARLRDNHAVSSEMVAGSPRLAHFQVGLAGNGPAATAVSTLKPFVTPKDAPSVLSRLLPVLVALWIAGLAFSSGRLWMRWRYLQRLIQGPFQMPSPSWRERFDRLMQLSGVKRIVRLGESAAVSVPIVAGWLKPVVLLPLGVMASLPAEQVEAILLHELAHIARHDYLINLLQSIVETVFFYHPAVWAVSRRIRLERELACDDRAVQWCASARTYAEALAGFEEFRAQSPALAATGDGDLFTRIHRILIRPHARQGSPGILARLPLLEFDFDYFWAF